MLCVVVDRVGRADWVAAGCVVLSCIQIAIKAREIAAADFQADAMSRPENVAGGPEVEGDLVRLAGVQELRLLA